MRRLALLLLATPLAAQAPDRPASAIAVALAGCWEPLHGAGPDALTCVVPENGGERLRVVTLGGGEVRGESRFSLDGERSEVSTPECTGWQSARPSSDGQRILIAGSMTCGRAPTQRRSGAFLLTPAGEWLRVEGSGMGTIARAELQVMRPVHSFAGVPAELREELGALAEEADAIRERLRRQPVSGADLIELEARGAAVPVIDAVVAASNPASFHLAVEGPVVPVAPPAEEELGLMPPVQHSLFGYPSLSWHDYSYLSRCSSYSIGFVDPRFCGYHSWYGYGSWGGSYWNNGFSGWWPGYYPGGVVVVPVPSRPGAGGRVVRGEGYRTPTPTAGTRTATPRTATSTRSGGSRSGSATPSGSTSSGSRGSSSGSSGGTRTAKPRSP